MDDSTERGAFNLHLVPVHQVDALWHVAEELLRRYCSKSDVLTLAELWQGCRSGRYWLNIGAFGDEPPVMAAVLCHEEHSSGPVVNVLAYGGRSPIRSWARASWDAFGRQIGLFGTDQIYIQAHRGLEKLLPVKPVQFVYRGTIGA